MQMTAESGMPAGKTTLVRQVAQLCGQPLVEVALHSGTDASDLLGGFEQHSPAATGQVATAPAVTSVRTLLAWAYGQQWSVWHLAWAWLCAACVVLSVLRFVGSWAPQCSCADAHVLTCRVHTELQQSCYEQWRRSCSRPRPGMLRGWRLPARQ